MSERLMLTYVQLIAEAECDFVGNTALLHEQAAGIAYDSRTAKSGDAFFCIRGAKNDGHDYAKEAYGNGARVFLCERELSLPHDALCVIVKNTRAALAHASAEFFAHPEKELTLIGVTGTKGKSSVCEMIREILEHVGKTAGSITTVGIKIGSERYESENSTPESYILFKNLRKMADEGVKYAVIEVSSQAMLQERVRGIRFAAAVFTNITRDHIGEAEHPNFEHYKECKKALFSRCDTAFINADTKYADEFIRACACPVTTYGIYHWADVCAEDISESKESVCPGVSFSCNEAGDLTRIYLSTPGIFSVYNAAAAFAVCRGLGISAKNCAQALMHTRIKGRFERVSTARKDIACIIDYAHNGESLRAALKTLRGHCAGRIICVFGAVGGRCKERRREMGICANAFADVCIVTADNPDTEPAEQIMREIAAYIAPEKCICIADRAQAIRCAVNTAESGDAILLAGKGHEEYQLINGKKLPFFERELLKKYAYDYTVQSNLTLDAHFMI